MMQAIRAYFKRPIGIQIILFIVLSIVLTTSNYPSWYIVLLLLTIFIPLQILNENILATSFPKLSILFSFSIILLFTIAFFAYLQYFSILPRTKALQNIFQFLPHLFVIIFLWCTILATVGALLIVTRRSVEPPFRQILETQSSEFYDIIETSLSNLQNYLNNLEYEFHRKSEELSKISRKLESKEQEIERKQQELDKISSVHRMPKKQFDAFLDEVHRRRRADYLISGIVGFSISYAFDWFFSLLSLFFN